MSTQNKVISIIGATGLQGGAIVESLLASGEFKVRAITRDVKSANAEALTKKGAEVVAGNILEPATIKKAIAGSYGLFAVTNYWDKDQMGKEFEIGKSLVDVAKEEKITHFIWSTLPDTVTESKGKYKVPVFTGKGLVEQYAKEAKFPYHTYVAAPFYYSNFQVYPFFKPKKNEDGTLSLVLPTKLTTSIEMGDVRELGPVVSNAFRNPKGWGQGEYIAVVGDNLPLSEILKALSDQVGTKVTLQSVPGETYKTFFPGADGFVEVFEWYEEYGYNGRQHDLTSGHKAKGSACKSFVEWLKETQFKWTSFQ